MIWPAANVCAAGRRRRRSFEGRQPGPPAAAKRGGHKWETPEGLLLIYYPPCGGDRQPRPAASRSAPGLAGSSSFSSVVAVVEWMVVSDIRKGPTGSDRGCLGGGKEDLADRPRACGLPPLVWDINSARKSIVVFNMLLDGGRTCGSR